MESRMDLFNGIEMGLGTWSWGDRLIWGFGNGYNEDDLYRAFTTAMENGVRFLDTAEIYGQGRSELTLGKFIHTVEEPLVIASKFMPFPWRLDPKSLLKKLKASLKRLEMERLQLYQIHAPLPPVKVETWMAEMVEAMQQGLTEAVGVSNYDLALTEKALNAMVKNGFRLASNQMEYNLLNRKIEKSGLLKFCQDEGITLISYSPLAMGALTGKYSPERPMSGYRSQKYSRSTLEKIQPLIKAMRKIGQEHDGKTAAQVAINWTICKGTIPIPGAKTAEQVEQNTGAADWRLTEEEVQYLDDLSDRVSM